jgi:hypothetical protein
MYLGQTAMPHIILTKIYLGKTVKFCVIYIEMYVGQTVSRHLTFILLMWRTGRAPNSIPIYSYI